MTPTGDLAYNPGTYPDWESNQWPFDLQLGAQSTGLHQPDTIFIFKAYLITDRKNKENLKIIVLKKD